MTFGTNGIMNSGLINYPICSVIISVLAHKFNIGFPMYFWNRDEDSWKLEAIIVLYYDPVIFYPQSYGVQATFCMIEAPRTI